MGPIPTTDTGGNPIGTLSVAEVDVSTQGRGCPLSFKSRDP